MQLASTVDEANRHDRPMGQCTLAARPMVRPLPTDTQPQHRCIEAGDDAATIRTVGAAWGDTAHMRTWGEDAAARQPILTYRARRWVVERTHAWRNRCRRWLIRWEKTIETYLAILHGTCDWITCRAARVFG